MNQSVKKNSSEKKGYVKPKLRVVKLRTKPLLQDCSGEGCDDLPVDVDS